MRTTNDYKRASHRDNFARTAAAVLLLLGPAFGPAAMGEAAPEANTLEDYRMLGLQAAMQTKGALGGELMKAMEAGGPENAVAFCNTRALPITREMSDRLGLDVSRVSDQPRNPANAANDEELAIIASFKEALARGQQPAPALREHDEMVVGYYPIVTNAMCLNCHGVEGVDISAATQAVIDERYPRDQATGYGEQELRGLFVVKMNRSQEGAASGGPGNDGNE
jgi:nitrate reductase cytochrome c-type subunit